MLSKSQLKFQANTGIIYSVWRAVCFVNAPSHMNYNLLEYGYMLHAIHIKSHCNVCLPVIWCALFFIFRGIAFKQESCSYFVVVIVVPIFVPYRVVVHVFIFISVFIFSLFSVYTFFSYSFSRWSLLVPRSVFFSALTLSIPLSLSVCRSLHFLFDSYKPMLAFIYSPLYLVYGGLYRFCF